jgi:hypothetical protein
MGRVSWLLFAAEVQHLTCHREVEGRTLHVRGRCVQAFPLSAPPEAGKAMRAEWSRTFQFCAFLHAAEPDSSQAAKTMEADQASCVFGPGRYA